MQYIVTSRGRPIGVTDLGFVRIDPRLRMGWFHPNADGARAMEVVAEYLPALKACARRGPDGVLQSTVGEDPTRSTEFADLAEAFQHADALDLRLLREDGSIVPTEYVNIKDIEQLLTIFGDEDGEDPLYEPTGDWMDADSPYDEDFEDFTELDARTDICLVDELEPWTPDEESVEFPRYQIQVRLASDNAIP